MITYKQLAKKEGISLATAYRLYPVPKPAITQAHVLILRYHGYSIRQIAAMLGISKDRVFRWLS